MHFETSTIGAREAKSLIARGLVAVQPRAVVVHSFIGTEHLEERLHAVFQDGTAVQVPAYAGDTVERISAIAGLSWGESEEAAFRASVESGIWPEQPAPDSTGARLSPSAVTGR